jgi:hypothetical protein
VKDAAPDRLSNVENLEKQKMGCSVQRTCRTPRSVGWGIAVGVVPAVDLNLMMK